MYCLIVFAKLFSLVTNSFICNSAKSYVRPRLEYAASVWLPYKLTDIDSIETIQRNFSKRIGLPRPSSYNQRLSLLGLPSLEERRIFADLKLLSQLLESDRFAALFVKSVTTHTRGHSKKLFKPLVHTDLRRNFFTIRVIAIWNSLPPSHIFRFPSTLAHTFLFPFLKRRTVLT